MVKTTATGRFQARGDSFKAISCSAHDEDLWLLFQNLSLVISSIFILVPFWIFLSSLVFSISPNLYFLVSIMQKAKTDVFHLKWWWSSNERILAHYDRENILTFLSIFIFILFYVLIILIFFTFLFSLLSFLRIRLLVFLYWVYFLARLFLLFLIFTRSLLLLVILIIIVIFFFVTFLFFRIFFFLFFFFFVFLLFINLSNFNFLSNNFKLFTLLGLISLLCTFLALFVAIFFFFIRFLVFAVFLRRSLLFLVIFSSRFYLRLCFCRFLSVGGIFLFAAAFVFL